MFHLILIENIKCSVKNDSTYKYLVQANKKSNWMSNIFLKYAVVVMVSCPALSFFASLSVSYIKEGGINNRYFIYPIRVV